MKRASLFLEEQILSQAEKALGTRGPTATVRAALEDVVKRHRLASLARWDIELDPADLDDLRESRFAPPRATS